MIIVLTICGLGIGYLISDAWWGLSWPSIVCAIIGGVIGAAVGFWSSPEVKQTPTDDEDDHDPNATDGRWHW